MHSMHKGEAVSMQCQLDMLQDSDILFPQIKCIRWILALRKTAWKRRTDQVKSIAGCYSWPIERNIFFILRSNSMLSFICWALLFLSTNEEWNSFVWLRQLIRSEEYSIFRRYKIKSLKDQAQNGLKEGSQQMVLPIIWSRLANIKFSHLAQKLSVIAVKREANVDE